MAVIQANIPFKSAGGNQGGPVQCKFNPSLVIFPAFNTLLMYPVEAVLHGKDLVGGDPAVVDGIDPMRLLKNPSLRRTRIRREFRFKVGVAPLVIKGKGSNPFEGSGQAAKVVPQLGFTRKRIW